MCCGTTIEIYMKQSPFDDLEKFSFFKSKAVKVFLFLLILDIATSFYYPDNPPLETLAGEHGDLDKANDAYLNKDYSTALKFIIPLALAARRAQPCHLECSERSRSCGAGNVRGNGILPPATFRYRRIKKMSHPGIL